MQGRNPARFKGGYGVPRGFKGEKSKSPPNPLGLAERVLRPQVVEGVRKLWKTFTITEREKWVPNCRFRKEWLESRLWRF